MPEIYEGIVEVKGAAREPGGRAKIAVISHDRDVDPVGACVGMRGTRVQAVVQELRGEKIDIVHWTADPAEYVCRALAPAKVSKIIMDEDEHAMEVIVPDDQLSLAIGKKGQNVRLASRLTGWKLDVRSESEAEDEARRARPSLTAIPGLGDVTAELLYQHGFKSAEEVAHVRRGDASPRSTASARNAPPASSARPREHVARAAGRGRGGGGSSGRSGRRGCRAAAGDSGGRRHRAVRCGGEGGGGRVTQAPSAPASAAARGAAERAGARRRSSRACWRSIGRAAQPGRGAYLHREPACWAAFVRRRGAVRSLRATPSRATREALVDTLAATVEAQ